MVDYTSKLLKQLRLVIRSENFVVETKTKVLTRGNDVGGWLAILCTVFCIQKERERERGQLLCESLQFFLGLKNLRFKKVVKIKNFLFPTPDYLKRSQLEYLF